MEIRTLKKSFAKTTFTLRSEHANIYQGYFIVVKSVEKGGKTTFLKLLSGHLTPDSGTIVGDCYMYPYQSQDKRPQLRVQEYLKSVIATDTLNSDEFKDIQMTLGLISFNNYSVNRLNLNEYQRLITLISLFSDKNVICIDTINLNPDENIKIARLLRDKAHKYKKTIICANSDTEFLKRADQIVNIVDGKCTIMNKTIWGG
jgi:translation initiation factor RLI1